MKKKPLPPLPKSQTDFTSSLLGFAAAIGMLVLLHGPLNHVAPLVAVGLVLLAGALPPVAADLFYFRRWREKSAGLNARRKLDWVLLARKLLGLLTTFAGFAALYWLLPEYHAPLYSNYWLILFYTMPFILVAAPFYFAWCLTREDAPHDGYEEMGWLALGCIEGRDWRVIGRHWRNWLVKGFFLPLMLVFMVNAIGELVTFDRVLSEIPAMFDLVNNGIMFADLLFAVLGYILTFRLLNTHIRSSEPTFFGWFVAVICYVPFWPLLYNHYFRYDPGPGWNAWLGTHSPLSVAWETAILLLFGIYSLATVCLGIRFSNLTYRGLITSGPYRFTKHPAYVAKNISWWLMSVPFIHPGWHALDDCAMLFGVNIIYYLRAKTEENHLSNYPEYVEYALAMNKRSIFRPLVQLLPFLEYKVPKNPPRI